MIVERVIFQYDYYMFKLIILWLFLKGNLGQLIYA
jgi:hypothetical protein